MTITSILYNECLRRRCVTKKGNVAQVEFYNNRFDDTSRPNVNKLWTSVIVCWFTSRIDVAELRQSNTRCQWIAYRQNVLTEIPYFLILLTELIKRMRKDNKSLVPSLFPCIWLCTIVIIKTALLRVNAMRWEAVVLGVIVSLSFISLL